jgi:hypothetical protein
MEIIREIETIGSHPDDREESRLDGLDDFILGLGTIDDCHRREVRYRELM